MNTVEPIRKKSDIERMKKALHGRDLLLFIVGINSTLRISDILALKVGDVRGREAVTLREKKTGKAKHLPWNQSVKKAVKTLVPANAADDDWLFPSRKGDKAISRVQAYRILNDAAERAGLDIQIGTHTLRKTMAYHAYKNGTDISLLMNVLNHSSQRETLRYIGITQDNVNNVFESINL